MCSRLCRRGVKKKVSWRPSTKQHVELYFKEAERGRGSKNFKIAPFMGRADVKVTDDFWEEIHDEKERVGEGEGVIAFYSCDYVILRERETLILEKNEKLLLQNG